MDEDFRKAALDYHRRPAPGSCRSSRPSAWPPSATWRWPIPPASPPPARRSPPIRRAPATNRPRQPGGGDHQRHRRAGPGQYRPAGLQAGDGRQGRPLQEVRRHRRLRPRGRRPRTRTSSSRSSPRSSPPSAASTWRTSRPRNASYIEQPAARAHEDPGLPRRPARHRHRLRRRRPQRAGAAGQDGSKR